MVPATGFEPVQCYLLEPESSASANSATRALLITNYLRTESMSEFDLKLVLVLELHQATPSNPQAVLPDRSNVHVRRQRSAPYQKVRDERKHPIRGLWVPNCAKSFVTREGI